MIYDVMLRTMIIFFLISNVYSFSNSRGYIKYQSWNQIRNILAHSSITNEMKEAIHKRIYYYYEFLALKQTTTFYEKYWKYCNHIPKKELSLYALNGLNRAIETYNPKYMFNTHAITYINGELFKGLTDLQPLTNLPKSCRRSSLWIKNNRKIFEIKTNPVLIQNDWQMDKLVNNNSGEDNSTINYYDKIDKYEKIWSKINNLESFTKQIYHLKYDYTFTKIRSNAKISHLLGCSEEYVRSKISKSKDTIYADLFSSKKL